MFNGSRRETITQVFSIEPPTRIEEIIILVVWRWMGISMKIRKSLKVKWRNFTIISFKRVSLGDWKWTGLSLTL